MSEESYQEKTEEPTPRRQKESREEGKVPRTQELSSAAILIAAGLAFGPGGEQMAVAFERITRASLTAGPTALSDPMAAVDWLRWVTAQTALGFLPFAASLAGLGLLVGAGQGRGTLSSKPLKPDWKRLSPTKNLKRYLSPRPIVDLGKALFKVTVVASVVYVVLGGGMADLSRLAQSPPAALVEVLRSVITRILLAAGLALVALAVLDYGYQSWQHQKELRMSKEEVRKETKEAEGDPLIRARLRSLGRSLTRMRMMSAVPTADVVITNPTRVAVALRYDPDEADAPVVVAMGSRKIAQRIRRIALESGVPVVENRPLARALLAAGRIGQPIPQVLYVAVAEILAFVFRRRRAHVSRERSPA